MEPITHAAITFLSLTLSAHGFFTLYLMLYTWWRPEHVRAAGSPDTYVAPSRRFTVLLPARHEEEVIGQTIRSVWSSRYPKDLLEVVVVCEHSDHATIREVERTIAAIGHPNVRLCLFSDGPINKPHGLNVALRQSTHEVVAIVDAEDDVHPDLFSVVNTIMERDGASVVQAGVQLMDFSSSWYAVHNVLEYFFWFKSRLHFHARMGMVPLGGNTVFMQRQLIEMAGGWDDRCLTEDADIGIRISVLGRRIAVTYDAEHATREETPPTLASFVKQRTRWNQGFLQVVRKGDWTRFGSLRQRGLAAYTLMYPFGQAFVGILWPVSVAMIVAVKMPVLLAMLSFIPLYVLGFQLLVNVVGLFEFAAVYRMRVRPADLAALVVGFLPYQFLLSVSAVRAVYREFRGQTNWEKTAHTGAHRELVRVAVAAGDPGE
jgi:cellulose synthase/poly-beta-1,6-N-acetylglucosamine synthase-like glycosyltransferase